MKLVRYISRFGKLKRKEFAIQFPAKFEDLTPYQLRLFSYLRLKFKNNEITETEFINDLVHYVLKIPTVFFRTMQQWQVNRISEELKFLFEQTEIETIIIPRFRHRGVTYHGPQNALETSCFGEWIWGDTNLNDYLAGDEAAIDKLIACLYRPATFKTRWAHKFNGKDIRAEFERDKVKLVAGRLKSLDQDLKMAIVTNYSGVTAYIRKSYSVVFKSSGGDASGGPLNVILSLAGAAYGDPEKVQRYDLHLILNQLLVNHQEAEKIKAKNPNNEATSLSF